MSFNTSQLTSTIQSKINCTPLTNQELLSLSYATKNLTTDRKNTVATVNDLPDLCLGTVSPGTIIFVDSLKIPVIAQDGCWSGLDNRELRNDFNLNTAWAWGYGGGGGAGGEGRLGTGDAISRSSPVSVVGGFLDWRQISVGAHSLGIRGNGSLWGWGLNNQGRLGDGTTTNRSSPVSVVGGFTDWCQVSGSGGHSLGVRSNCTLWAWGYNGQGRLGDNSTINRSSPVSVVGGFTDWCQAAAAAGHSVALRTNGTAWAWGIGNNGRLGTGNTIQRSSPVSVVGGFTDWCQISSTGAHAVGVRCDGTVWGWGFNGSGQLGDNSLTDRSSPVSVVGGLTWCQVSANYNNSAAIKSDGTAWAWGAGSNGILGDETLIGKCSPVSVVGGFTDWCQINASSSHMTALRTNSSVWSWGEGLQGRLGDGTTINRSSPVSLIGGFCWAAISSGRGCHSFAIRVQ
jgi:alpha-tubulin suppressor-like RCC1 family protein